MPQPAAQATPKTDRFRRALRATRQLSQVQMFKLSSGRWLRERQELKAKMAAVYAAEPLDVELAAKLRIAMDVLNGMIAEDACRYFGEGK